MRLTYNAWRLVSRYMVLAGAVANLLLAAFFLFWLGNKVSATETYRDVRRLFHGPPDGVQVLPVVPVAAGQLNPALRDLPAGTWFKIHELSRNDPGFFVRQSHGGAAFDPVRGRVMLFGSDTHRIDWDNTVRFFDMGTLSWSAAYPPDAPDTYRVNEQGLPVAGQDESRPWAMHAFDAVEFDPISDRLIVASHPGHMGPDKSWGVDRAQWARIKSHPTWSYLVGENRWEPLVEDGKSFFPYGATFDPIRRRLVGVSSDGFWELDVEERAWQKLGGGAPQGWHNAAAYDADRDVVVSYGTHKNSNDIWQYRRGEALGRQMPTPGSRPPGGQSVPLAYHSRSKRIVALINATSADATHHTATWLYSSGQDVWERHATASIPFPLGMNYMMVYDSNHDLMVLVANYPGEPVAVWVLRL